MTRIAAKQKTVFACTVCGQTGPKWLGQCPACRTWNTLQEEVVTPEPKGATIGVFEMKSGGLVEVPNPSAFFLAERPLEAPGSAVAAVLNGTRTVLVEIQALVAPTGFGTPRRTALGIDSNRVAVLERKVGLELLACDLFVNVAGGLTLDDDRLG